MEKKLNDKAQLYMSEFKDKIKSKIVELGLPDIDKEKTSELLAFIYDHDRLVFHPDELMKRKRVKNAIPVDNRCIAYRAGKEQCTRKRRDGCDYCGTHSKGTPHGVYNANDANIVLSHSIEVFATEISGIVYYIDNIQNVYKTEDILESRENPQIVAKWVKVGTSYTIPQFGI